MDGFKNTTKTQYFKGGSTGTKGAAKVAKVMGEFKRGELHSGSKRGPDVTSRKQTVAIALSEARKAPLKKAEGGAVSARPTTGRGRRISDEELSTPERILRQSGQTDPYERMPPKPTPPARKPLGKGSFRDIPLVGKYAVK